MWVDDEIFPKEGKSKANSERNYKIYNYIHQQC
jgi:hypothetical protein